MSNWSLWKPAYDLLTLENCGDSNECRGAQEFGLNTSFQNFEVFWRYHVAPATNRPANIDFRPYASREISMIATLNHSIFVDLVGAAESLAKVNSGDLGGDRFRHATDVLKCAGDAVQKFTDFQQCIETNLSARVNQSIRLWTTADWNNIWKPRRENIINYRNFLTHMGCPQVMHVCQSNGQREPYVLHQDYIVRGNYLTWQEQEQVYNSNPERWAKLVDVCNELNTNSISWLNDAYEQALIALDPWLGTDIYLNLMGWDTATYGRHVAHQSAPVGIQGVYMTRATSGQNYP